MFMEGLKYEQITKEMLYSINEIKEIIANRKAKKDN